MILQHPLFDEFLARNRKLPEHWKDYRLSPSDLPTTPEKTRNYRDPLAADPEGQQYDQHWLARMELVHVAGQDVGWGVIVQESYDATIGSALADLRRGLIRSGAAAVAMIVLVLLAMWGLALRLLHGATPLRRSLIPGQPSERSATATTPTGTALSRSAHGASPTDNQSGA
jgi:hypothetical protein